MNGSAVLYCRTNGRAYRLSRGADKLWRLSRIEGLGDAEGALIGQYQRRSDATKVVATVAWQPESRW